MATINKVVRIGRTRDVGNLFCKIQFDGRKLSITGVECPTPNGNCRGSCGQIDMHEWDIAEFAPGWTPEVVAIFRKVWSEYHLNDMQAGSPAQTAYLKAHPIDDRLNHYTKACEALASAGLNPDFGYLHEGAPYRYGHAWLYIEVPESVLAFLSSLPDTDITPAWV